MNDQMLINPKCCGDFYVPWCLQCSWLRPQFFRLRLFCHDLFKADFMFRLHNHTAKTHTLPARLPSGLRLTILSDDEHVRVRGRQAAAILGGVVDGEFASLDNVPSSDTKADIYILDPRLLSDPAKDAPGLLDDRGNSVVLFGAPAGLVATRSAVRRVVDVDMGPDVLATVLRKVKSDSAAQQEPPKLSLRERETLRLYGRGMTLKVIGHRLGISAKSAETYKTRACQKLGLCDRAAVLTFTEPSLDQI
ncbi:LuxR C-terminal-related transcriptional regulator [Loktanella sp. R86503]|uniref:helix-turn-helix transcriptional regulator n=1 Tax=Loktanella sp. R86503 TaxID=3093847 RepID=UPI0036DD1731